MPYRDSEVSGDEKTELMRRVAGDDLEAYERLYRQLSPILRHFFAGRGADPPLCDDLTQKIFAGLWRQRKGFRAESSFQTYLFAIASNTLSKEIRRSRAIETALRSHPGRSGRAANGLSHPEAEVYLKELKDAIESAKDMLTEEQRRALDAAEGMDAPPDEMLEELGCSKEALKGRLKRARKRLRELLTPILEDEETRDEA